MSATMTPDRTDVLPATEGEIAQHIAHGRWRGLAESAYHLLEETSRRTQNYAPVTLGGGVRLMLALGHRTSHDLDLYTPSATWIGDLSPRRNAATAALVKSYVEKGDRLTLTMHGGGTLHLRVRDHLLDIEPDANSGNIDYDTATAGRRFAFDSVAEVLARKLYYDGSALSAKDLFDWRALVEDERMLIPPAVFGDLLEPCRERIEYALGTLSQSKNAQDVWDRLRTPLDYGFMESILWANNTLEQWRQAAIGAPYAADRTRDPDHGNTP